MATAPASMPSLPSSPPGIFRCDAPPTNLRYWDGKGWTGGPVAAIWPRIWGNVIDVFLAFLLTSVLFAIFSLPFPSASQSTAGETSAGSTIALFAAFLVGFVGYFAVSYRLFGRTLGMLLAGTHLVSIPTGVTRLTWGPALVRAFVLSAGFFCGFLWLIWLLITGISKTRQGPHDLAAKTAVLTSRVKRVPPQRPAPVSPPAPPEVQPLESGTPPRVTDPMATPTRTVEIPDEPPRNAANITQVTTANTTRVETPPNYVDSDPLEALGTDPRVRIFLSHASEDDSVAVSLASALEAQGLQTWLASRDVSIGGNYAAEIFQNLVNSDYLLVVLSPSSVESAHVRREVSIAIDRKVQVLPVSTDPSGQLMANLPEDWQYWLNIAQVFRMTDEDSTAIEIARRVK